MSGADGGGRTHTSSRIPDFESSASANSATSARPYRYNSVRGCCKQDRQHDRRQQCGSSYWSNAPVWKTGSQAGIPPSLLWVGTTPWRLRLRMNNDGSAECGPPATGNDSRFWSEGTRYLVQVRRSSVSLCKLQTASPVWVARKTLPSLLACVLNPGCRRRRRTK